MFSKRVEANTFISHHHNTSKWKGRNTEKKTDNSIKKAETSTVTLKEITLQYYTREKKPSMPKCQAKVRVQSLKFLCEQRLMAK